MLSRRHFIAAAGLGCAGLLGWRLWPRQGILNPCLGPLPAALAQHPIVRAAWEGLDPASVWDSHVHLLGTGAGTDGATGFNEGRGWQRPWRQVQRRFFLNAACAETEAPDAAYVARLGSLADAMPPGWKGLLLALDRPYDAAGHRDDEHSHAWTSNDYCHAVASANPKRFAWAASIHPYRHDALAELTRVKTLGALAVKWIPAAQGIDPASPRCDAFYEVLVKQRLPLITHAGEERAAPGDDELGNPLRLRRALDHGVRVVVAHCASMGVSRDLDASANGGAVDSFSLFERLMDLPQYVGRLYGDIAALPQSARAGLPLRRVLQRARAGGDWADRLLNGSDYPLPGLMPLYAPEQLAAQGLLDAGIVEPLSAIRRHNSLLFDFVLKRHLRLDGQGLAKRVFETRNFFGGDTLR